MEMRSATCTAEVHSKIYPPLNHYDYRILDIECRCQVCHDWRMKQQAFQKLVPPTAGHARNCACHDCWVKMRARSAYIAASNRRDLYSESSWHASQITDHNCAFDAALSAQGSGMGLHFMKWVQGQLRARGDGWWVISAPYRAVSDWIDDFTAAAVASGIVVQSKLPVVCRP